MLEHVIDNKKIVSNDKESIIDLTPSIFDSGKSIGALFNVYRVPESMKMRIDLISLAAYGTDEYADIIMKYNGISNPFSIDADDILFIPTLDTVENDLIRPVLQSNAAVNIRNYHKYIDKNKAPVTIGSEINNKYIDKNKAPIGSEIDNKYNDTLAKDEYFEANISKPGETSITLRNGRIYFGKNCNTECAVDGITASDFLISKIENEL